jgi:hypothetical protein
MNALQGDERMPKNATFQFFQNFAGDSLASTGFSPI